VAIKDPTAAVFDRQAGSNLLMIGQDVDAARGILGAIMVGLAAQHPAQAPDLAALARFYVLDGSPTDAAHADLFPRVCQSLPHSARLGGWRNVGAITTELADEVERRLQQPDATIPYVYLFVFGLHRFRDLRAPEDDFGFSRRAEDQPATPTQQFREILREGPGVGIFTVVWCDSLTDLHRSLDRQALRDFEMRVLFQVSAADSGILIDSPAAGKLGPNRALFHSEDKSQPEKFRPYALPQQAWLDEVAQLLKAK
jgi:hypothetical protein